MKSNPTLLDLLETGASVEFPNEVKLVGLPKEGFIRIIYAGAREGHMPLDRNGLAQAIERGEKLYAEHRGDDFSDICGPKGYVGGIGIFTKRQCDHKDVSAAIELPKGSALLLYNVVNENGEWLDGHNTRFEIRRAFQKRLVRS